MISFGNLGLFGDWVSVNFSVMSKDRTHGLAVTRMKNLLTEKKWSYTEFAKILNVKPQTINHWLKRDRIASGKLPQVARTLGVTVEYLLTGQTPDFDEIFQNLTKAQQDELLAEARKMSDSNQQALAIAEELQARRKSHDLD